MALVKIIKVKKMKKEKEKKKKINEKNEMKKKEKKKEKEESKLKIHKGWLGFNGGYLSRKPVKGGSSKGRKPHKAIQSMKFPPQRAEVESKILLGRIKIVRL